jgi:hypothetical protein
MREKTPLFVPCYLLQKEDNLNAGRPAQGMVNAALYLHAPGPFTQNNLEGLRCGSASDVPSPGCGSPKTGVWEIDLCDEDDDV